MNIPELTDDEQLKLELMAYADPIGLHPNEVAWREFARKLANHISAQEQVIKTLLLISKGVTKELENLL